MRTVKLCSLSDDTSSSNYLSFCTKLFKALYMKVYRTGSYITSSRKSYICVLMLSKKSSYKIIGCTDLSDIFIINRLSLTDSFSAYNYCVSILIFYRSSDILYSFKKSSSIGYIRYILYCNFVVCHYCCCKYTKSGILCTCYNNFSFKASTASNDVLFFIMSHG